MKKYFLLFITMVVIFAAVVKAQGKQFIHTNTSHPISLIPNPANSSVRLQIQEPISFPVTLKLINTMGIEVFSTRLYQNSYTLSLSSYPSGLYVVLVSTADKVFKAKLVLER